MKGSIASVLSKIFTSRGYQKTEEKVTRFIWESYKYQQETCSKEVMTAVYLLVQETMKRKMGDTWELYLKSLTSTPYYARKDLCNTLTATYYFKKESWNMCMEKKSGPCSIYSLQMHYTFCINLRCNSNILGNRLHSVMNWMFVI